MATKDLKLVHDIYKGKDERNENYYLNVKAIDDNGDEVILLDHINNKSATGSKLLQNLTNRVKNDYVQLIIEEYKAFSPGSAGAVEPIQVHNVLLKNNKPAKSENTDMFNMFGGFQGFVNFTSEQSRIKGQIEALNERIFDLKESKAQLIAKLGNYESENKKLETEIRKLQDQIRDLKWEHDDKSRAALNKHDEELRKYKGQHAIINAGVQGLGSLLMKKLNVSGEAIAGFLGMDIEGTEPEQEQPQAQKSNIAEVVVEQTQELTPEQTIIKEKADMIYKWCMLTNPEIMDKVFVIFKAISTDEENLNSFFEMAQSA